MKKKLQRRFGLRRETLQNLTESAYQQVVAGGFTEPYDWSERGGASCYYRCDLTNATATDMGCGTSCDLSC